MTVALSPFEKARIKFRDSFKRGIKPADVRQPIPDDVALNMIKELDVPKDSLIGVFDAFLILSTHLKEQGYTNIVVLESHHTNLTTLQEQYYNKVKTVCEKSNIKYYVPPRNNLSRSEMKFSVIIGNPPYGNRGSMAVKFLNQSLELSDDVRMILPMSFTKPSITNQVSMDHECVSEEMLPDNTFPNGIKAVYQVWKPADVQRQKIVLPTSHPDFEFVKYDDRETADLMIGAVGSGPSGKVFTENFSHYQPKHHFIKCKNQQVIDRLIELGPTLRELSKQQNGRGGVCKSDIVVNYSQLIGE